MLSPVVAPGVYDAQSWFIAHQLAVTTTELIECHNIAFHCQDVNNMVIFFIRHTFVIAQP
jgi:hypothetical protein